MVERGGWSASLQFREPRFRVPRSGSLIICKGVREITLGGEFSIRRIRLFLGFIGRCRHGQTLAWNALLALGRSRYCVSMAVASLGWVLFLVAFYPSRTRSTADVTVFSLGMPQ